MSAEMLPGPGSPGGGGDGLGLGSPPVGSRLGGAEQGSAAADGPGGGADTVAALSPVAAAGTLVDEVALPPADRPRETDLPVETAMPDAAGAPATLHSPRRHPPEAEPGPEPEPQPSPSTADEPADSVPPARPPSPRSDPDPPIRPLPPGGPAQVAARVRDQLGEVLPDLGTGDWALKNLDRLLHAESVQSRHPHTIAHLHCPTLPVAVAADALVAEINPSMDSWDQSAAACVIEDELIDAIGRLVYPAARPDPHGPPGGAVTSGGTEGNLLALLFARDEAVRRHFDADPAQEGLPGFAAGKLIVLCSAVAHFSVARAAALLGLGEQAVHTVPVNADHTMDPAELARIARRLHSEGRRIAMVVATAGTTDAGAIDPLGACEEVARRHGAWFHVDAAYAGPLLFSPRHATRLAGIEQADSVSLDLHKFGWQPIPAGLLLTRTRDAFALAGRRVAYLSDLDDEQAGYPNLLGRSLRTTRRADAVKMVATMQALGRSGLAERIERCFELTGYAAAALARDDRFELAMRPTLTTVLFRYLPRSGDPDQINAALRRRLLVDGSAVVGRTRLPEILRAGSVESAGPGDRVHSAGLADQARLADQADLIESAQSVDPAYSRSLASSAAMVGFGRPGALRLKLTLLNPDTTAADLDRLIELIAAAGAEEERARATSLASPVGGGGPVDLVGPDGAADADGADGPRGVDGAAGAGGQDCSLGLDHSASPPDLPDPSDPSDPSGPPNFTSAHRRDRQGTP